MVAKEWWSILPDDILSLVYSRVACAGDHVRFAAVCRSWRACATTSPHAAPPVLPWLMFSDAREDDNKTKVYCPEDGRVFRMSLPSQAVGKRFVGAHDGGWVAAIGGESKLVIVNLVSGTEVSLPARNAYPTYKIVFSESPASSGCILAAIMSQYGVAVCQIGCPNGTWTVKQLDGLLCLMDIVFYNRALYGITSY